MNVKGELSLGYLSDNGIVKEHLKENQQTYISSTEASLWWMLPICVDFVYISDSISSDILGIRLQLMVM